LIVCCHPEALGICHSSFKPAKTEKKHNVINCSHEMNYMNNMCIQYTLLFLQASIINVNNAAVLRKFRQWNRASTVKQTKRCQKVFLVKNSPFIFVPLDSSPLKM